MAQVSVNFVSQYEANPLTGTTASETVPYVFQFSITTQAQQLYIQMMQDVANQLTALQNEYETYGSISNSSGQPTGAAATAITQLQTDLSSLWSWAGMVQVNTSGTEVANALAFPTGSGINFSYTNPTTGVTETSVTPPSSSTITPSNAPTMNQYMAQDLEQVFLFLASQGYQVQTASTAPSTNLTQLTSTISSLLQNPALFGYLSTPNTTAPTGGSLPLVQQAVSDAQSAVLSDNSQSILSSSLQQILMTDYVAQGNSMIFNQMSQLQTAMNANQQALSFLNAMQDLMNQKTPQQFIEQLGYLLSSTPSYTQYEQSSFGGQLGDTPQFTNNLLQSYLQATLVNPTTADNQIAQSVALYALQDPDAAQSWSLTSKPYTATGQTDPWQNTWTIGYTPASGGYAAHVSVTSSITDVTTGAAVQTSPQFEYPIPASVTADITNNSVTTADLNTILQPAIDSMLNGDAGLLTQSASFLANLPADTIPAYTPAVPSGLPSTTVVGSGLATGPISQLLNYTQYDQQVAAALGSTISNAQSTSGTWVVTSQPYTVQGTDSATNSTVSLSVENQFVISYTPPIGGSVGTNSPGTVTITPEIVDAATPSTVYYSYTPSTVSLTSGTASDISTAIDPYLNGGSSSSALSTAITFSVGTATYGTVASGPTSGGSILFTYNDPYVTASSTDESTAVPLTIPVGGTLANIAQGIANALVPTTGIAPTTSQSWSVSSGTYTLTNGSNSITAQNLFNISADPSTDSITITPEIVQTGTPPTVLSSFTPITIPYTPGTTTNSALTTALTNALNGSSQLTNSTSLTAGDVSYSTTFDSNVPISTQPALYIASFPSISASNLTGVAQAVANVLTPMTGTAPAGALATWSLSSGTYAVSNTSGNTTTVQNVLLISGNPTSDTVTITPEIVQAEAGSPATVLSSFTPITLTYNPGTGSGANSALSTALASALNGSTQLSNPATLTANGISYSTTFATNAPTNSPQPLNIDPSDTSLLTYVTSASYYYDSTTMTTGPYSYTQVNSTTGGLTTSNFLYPQGFLTNSNSPLADQAFQTSTYDATTNTVSYSNTYSFTISQLIQNLQNLIQVVTTATGASSTDVSSAGLTAALQQVVSDLEGTDSTSGNNSTGSLVTWVQDMTSGSPGTFQNDLNNAIVSSQSFNDAQNANLQQVMFVFQEFYQSAITLTTNLNQLIAQMAQGIVSH